MRANNQEIALTLDMAWDLCLNQQWNWIKAQIEAWPKLSKALTSDVDIEGLKDQWCRENGFEDIWVNCFFCEYADQQQLGGRDCDKCPGRLVDPKFHCEQSEYHFGLNPLAFHAELVRLNNIRLGLKEFGTI